MAVDPGELGRADEEIEHLGIEVRPALSHQNLGRLLEAEGRPVRPGVRERVEAVGDGGDTTCNGNRFPGVTAFSVGNGLMTGSPPASVVERLEKRSASDWKVARV